MKTTILILIALTVGVFYGMNVRQVPCPEYVDGTEANELLDAGFRIFDTSGVPVRCFLADGSHVRAI